MATFGTGAPNPSVPAAHKGDNAEIFNATLTANYVAGTVLECKGARTCALTIKYNTDASGTPGKPGLVILGSNHSSAPLVTDDEWGVLAELEGTGTDATLGDSLPASVDFTLTPEFNVRKLRGTAVDFYASDNATDKLRKLFPLDVSYIKYLVVLAKEEGDTDAGDLGALVVLASLSA